MSQLTAGADEDQKRKVSMHAVKEDHISVKAKGSKFLHTMVSKKKRRFVQGGYDLDLTYITDRIIAMGFPSEKMEAMYRNDITDVKQFFDARHKEHYMVYNLCSERSYDHAKFDNRVVRFPFDDHNCPKFDDLEPFCDALDEWLSADPSNIAAIHCKAGKGRTGLVICVYLLHTGMWEKAVDSLRFYGVSRTQNQKGVTIPSQRRWVQYYEKLMGLRRQGLSMPKSKWHKVKKIFVSNTCPKFQSCTIFNNETKYTCSIKDKTINNVSGGFEVTPKEAIVNKDVKVQFDGGGAFKKTRVFSFWFCTDFIENNKLRLDKDEIDKVNKDKKCKQFYLEMTCEVAESKNDDQADAKAGSLQLLVSDMSNEQIVVTALRLQDNLVIRNRGWKGVIYEDCFTGADVCKWLTNDGGLADLNQAREFGNLLIKEKVLYGVKREGELPLKELKDGPFFYRFNTSPPKANK